MVTPPRYGPRGRRTRRWEVIEPNLWKLQYIIRHQATGVRPNNRELCDTLTALSPVAVMFVADINSELPRAFVPARRLRPHGEPRSHVFTELEPLAATVDQRCCLLSYHTDFGC